eukprot:CAMPEP_0174856904 /NCGR_PEP_ID=MMETSP1114-20130205/36633_1 /TAXON_ID=312471 /ORGANISM="Neobodo designis, Strain CCAP 1951/1" /LENGTH=35 /DNA_ID= /DNA_START= /DNA_END= /DNA_ORIENTATION=
MTPIVDRTSGAVISCTYIGHTTVSIPTATPSTTLA